MLPVVYKKDRLPPVGYIVKWVHSQVTKGFRVLYSYAFFGWLVCFSVGFVRFCFICLC